MLYQEDMIGSQKRCKTIQKLSGKCQHTWIWCVVCSIATISSCSIFIQTENEWMRLLRLAKKRKLNLYIWSWGSQNANREVMIRNGNLTFLGEHEKSIMDCEDTNLQNWKFRAFCCSSNRENRFSMDLSIGWNLDKGEDKHIKTTFHFHYLNRDAKLYYLKTTRAINEVCL